MFVDIEFHFKAVDSNLFSRSGVHEWSTERKWEGECVCVCMFVCGRYSLNSIYLYPVNLHMEQCSAWLWRENTLRSLDTHLWLHQKTLSKIANMLYTQQTQRVSRVVFNPKQWWASGHSKAGSAWLVKAKEWHQVEGYSSESDTSSYFPDHCLNSWRIWFCLFAFIL